MGATATELIMQLAAEQHGVVGVRQLASLGVTRRWLDNLVRRAVLVRVGAGVYVVSGAARTWFHRLTVGRLVLQDEAWVSHEAAAALHQLDRRRHQPVEFTVLRSGKGRARRAPCVVHTTLSLPLIDRVTVEGFRCTSATRTLIDLAHSRIPVVRLEAAIDSAVRLGLSSPTALVTRLEQLRGPGRWGARTLDRLLVDSGGHTTLERRFLVLVRQAGLPRPRTQVIHRRGGTTVARVDFLFDGIGVVVEVSGQHGHSSPTERARDAQRRNELQDLGRRVYEYTWNDVTKRPAYVERTLVERLIEAGWRR